MPENIPSDPSPLSGSSDRRPPSRRRGFLIAITILLLIWVVAMLFRMQIRAQWWSYRLTQVQSQDERAFYVARLASIGDRSLAALPRVLNHPCDEVREAGITILHYCPDDRARVLLLERLHDRNEDVGARAALELSRRKDSDEVMPMLRDVLLNRGDPHTGIAAAVALERIGGPDAEAILISALRQTEDANLRAQIIDSLGILGSRSAVPAITRCLSDDRPVTCLPASQRSAQRAIAALQGDLAGKGIDVPALLEANRRAATVSSTARRSIHLITATMPAETATGPN